MRHPQNFRAYGVLLRGGKVMIAAEYIAKTFAWKFPGGGVEVGETAEEALVREFMEETGLAIDVLEELYDPGTRISPLTHAPYTPIYFLVTGDGEPVVPAHENVEIAFMEPGVVLASDLVPSAEKVALRRTLDIAG